MTPKIKQRIQKIREYSDVADVRRENRRLQREVKMRGYQLEDAHGALARLRAAHDIVRREALQAEQIITGVEHHLRAHPHDAARVIHNMISAR